MIKKQFGHILKKTTCPNSIRTNEYIEIRTYDYFEIRTNAAYPYIHIFTPFLKKLILS